MRIAGAIWGQASPGFLPPPPVDRGGPPPPQPFVTGGAAIPSPGAVSSALSCRIAGALYIASRRREEEETAR